MRPPTIWFAPLPSSAQPNWFERLLLRRARWLARLLKRTPLLRRLVKNLVFVPPFKTVVMPVIRSAYPDLSINSLVGVDYARGRDQSNCFTHTLSGPKENP